MKRPIIAPRETPLPGGRPLVIVLSVVAALAVSALFLVAAGVDPMAAFEEVYLGTFGDWYAISDVLTKMIPLLITSLAVSLAFTMNLWNIGAEGQLLAGAMGAGAVALGAGGLPSWLLLPLMALGGMVAGGLWALGPAWLKARLQVNEIITTLMLNYVALHLLDYLVFGPFKDPTSFGFPMSPVFSKSGWLPVWGSTRVHMGLLLGLGLALVNRMLLGATPLGLRMRVIGANRLTARLSGMPVARTMILALVLSGAAAGLAGMSEVAGIQHRLQPGLSQGYGYTAIIIAWLAGLSPLATILVSFFFAALFVGGEVLQMTMKLSAHISSVMQGLILFFVLAGDFVSRFRVRWIERNENGR